MSYTTKVYRTDDGDKLVVASGGVLDVESGGALKLDGTQVTATAAQLNAVAAGTGTTNQTFTIDSDGAAGTLELKAGVDSGNHKTTVQTGTGTVGAVTLTLPNATGTIALTGDTQTDLDLGASGTPGSLDIFPAAAANGKLTITATNNGGARNVTITNDAVAATRNYTIPEAGGHGKFVMTTAANSLLVNTNGNDRTMSLAGNVTLAGALTSAGALDLGDHALTLHTAGATTLTLPAAGTLLADGGSSGLTGTTNATFGVDSDIAKPRITISSDAAGAGDFTATVKPAATMTGNRTIRLPDADGTLALATGAETGTTSSGFTVDSDSANAKIALNTNAATGNFTLSLVPANLSANRTVTFQDAAAQIAVARDTTDILTNKTLTAPVVNGATTAAAANDFDLSAGTGQFKTPLGILTLNGNVVHNGNITFDFSGSNGTFKTSTGVNTLGGSVVISGASTLTTGSGAATLKGSATFDATKTLTFGSALGGAASVVTMYSTTAAKGAFILSPTDNATDHAVTLTNGAANGGAATITTPSATCTLSGLGLAESLSGVKTFTATPIVAIDDAAGSAVTDVLTLKHTTSGAPSAGMGVGIGVTIENDTDIITEVANLDFVMSNDGTKNQLDVDVLLNTMVAGASTRVFTFDADEGGAGGAKLWQFGSDANAVLVELHPPTTNRGTLRFQAVDSTGDTILTVTHEAQTQATTFKIPDLNVAAGQFVCVNSDHTVNVTAANDRAVTLGGNFISAGALDLGDHALTLHTTGATEVTLPTTGTLATLAGAEALTNKSIDGDANTVRDIAPISTKIGVVGVRGGAVPVSGIPSSIVFDMDNTAGSSTWTNATGQMFRILDIRIVKTDSLGGANDKVQVSNDVAPITDLVAINVADGTLLSPGTVVDGLNVIPNGGTLVVTTTKGTDHCECEVSVIGMLV